MMWACVYAVYTPDKYVLQNNKSPVVLIISILILRIFMLVSRDSFAAPSLCHRIFTRHHYYLSREEV
jgi:hypothetical protein